MITDSGNVTAGGKDQLNVTEGAKEDLDEEDVGTFRAIYEQF